MGTPPRRRKLVNSGEYTIVRLERDEYTQDEPIVGTVEVSNPRRKDITHVSIEFSTWRSVSVPGGKQAHIEQIYVDNLELFPNPTEAASRTSDSRVLHDRAHYSFTFAPTSPPRPPTVDMDGGHIKHYLTCRVLKRSGVLRGEKQLEKNQFQVPIKPTVLEVDALFPDRTFACIESRHAGSNASYLDMRVRCNTHLLAGLPFLVELDMVSPVDIRSIALSLHSRIAVSVGQSERELSYKSAYIYDSRAPDTTHGGGHFRERGSTRSLAHGRPSWLIEWNCPPQSSQARLPFPRTLYTKTANANMECGLTLKVEVVLNNGGGGPLVGLVHGITYCPEWSDARQDQTTSLKFARSIQPARTSVHSIDGLGLGLGLGDRRGSAVSEHSFRRQLPASAAAMGVTLGTRPDSGSMASPRFQFSGFQASHNGGPALFGSGGLVLGTTNPSASPRIGSSPLEVVSSGAPTRDDYFAAFNSARMTAPSVRSVASSQHDTIVLGSGHTAQHSRTSSVRSGHMGPPAGEATLRKAAAARLSGQQNGSVALPPADIRATLTTAFDNLAVTRSDNVFLDGGFADHPTPPPKAPLPAAPVSTIDNSPSSTDGSPDGYGPSSQVHAVDHSDPVAMAALRQKRQDRQPARPPVVLGVSQDTVQVNTTRSSSTAAPPQTVGLGLGLTSAAQVSRVSTGPPAEDAVMTPDALKAMSYISSPLHAGAEDKEVERERNGRDSGIGSVAPRYGSGVSQLAGAVQLGQMVDASNQPINNASPVADSAPAPSPPQVYYSPTLLQQQQFHRRHNSQTVPQLSSSVQSTTLGRWGDQRGLSADAATSSHQDSGEILLG